MTPIVRAVLDALLFTAIVVGPVIVLLVISWRSIVIGGLGVCAIFAFFGSVLAAGGTAWNPSSGNPFVVLLFGWGIAAALAWACWKLASFGTPVNPTVIILALAAVSWALMMKSQLVNAWWVVGNREAVQHVYGQPPRKHPKPRPDLTTRGVNGVIVIVSPDDHVDIVYLTPGEDQSDRLIRLLADPDLKSLLGSRALMVIVPRFGTVADSLDGRTVMPDPAHPLTILADPSFYDRDTRTFRMGAYEWMIDRLGMPPHTASAMFYRHFDRLPPEQPDSSTR